jgi:hypothetical protein
VISAIRSTSASRHAVTVPKANRRTWRSILVLAFLLIPAAALPATAQAAPKPAFTLTTIAGPTNFVPGSSSFGSTAAPGYNFAVSNIGGAATAGDVTFTDTLPAGLTPTDAQGYADNSEEFFGCNIAGQTVTCTNPTQMNPNQRMLILISVEVDIAAPPSVINHATVSGGGAGTVSTESTTTISDTPAPFDFLPGTDGLATAITAPDGLPVTQAGARPSQLTLYTGFPTRGSGFGNVRGIDGGVRDISVKLPEGFIADPTATPVLCSEAQLETIEPPGKPGCPDASQVGVITIYTYPFGFTAFSSAIFNMVPPPGHAAAFGFDILNFPGKIAHIMGGVDSAGNYQLTGDVNDILSRGQNPIMGVQTELWGVPSNPSHNYSRGECILSQSHADACPVSPSSKAFLTMPSACSGPLTTSGRADSWGTPGVFHPTTAQTRDPNGDPVGVSGCNQLDFTPTIEAKPTTNLSDSPSGLDFKLHLPQVESFEGLAEANLKDARVTLPAGVSINPSSANGLAACSPAQLGLTSAVGQLPVRTDASPARCPDASKIGNLEVDTPLLDHPLSGAIYVAQPYQNPFGSLLAIYLAVDDKETGTVIKLAGKVEADPRTGQLTSTFVDNPELPFEDFKLHFFGGPRAALKTPLPCGEYTTTSDFTPWSTPEGADATPSDSFTTSVAAGGSGVCPASEAVAPNKPAFSAGTIAPAAGAYSPFVLKLSREDGSQRLTAIDTTLPRGLTAKLAGVSYCSEAQIAAAKAREAPNQGSLEQRSPSCPASSEVGTVNVGAGAGITPIYVQGHAYLAGPYKGAPLSLVIVTPAVSGPYDLGAVVVRTALHVDPESAQVHAVSDPIPQIIQGIPLDVRSIALKMDRPDFTLNPTSCDPMSILGSASAATGQSAALAGPFQVGGCSALGFRPKLAIRLDGGTKRNRNPALTATLTYPKGAYANIASASVALPHSEFLDQGHIRTICTRVQFAEGGGNGERCPPGSVYGHATAVTPLLDQPLAGPVYLRSSSHKLPDLVAALGGQVDVDLVGRVDSVRGGIRTTFETVPDAPVSRFVLKMKGAKKGLLINSEDICSKPQRAVADFTAQNGKVYDTTPLIANDCKAKKRHTHKKQHKARR